MTKQNYCSQNDFRQNGCWQKEFIYKLINKIIVDNITADKMTMK